MTAPVRKARPADTTRIVVKQREPETATPDGLQDANRKVARAIVVGTSVKKDMTTGHTKEVSADDFLEGIVSNEKVVEPPFDQLVLSMLVEHSTELEPALAAMEVNIDGFGYKLTPRVKPEAEHQLPEDQRGAADELQTAVAQERVMLTNFFNNCGVDDTFTDIRRKTRRDLESTGNAYWEIIRHPTTKKIQQINHVPSYTIRLGAIDKEFTQYQRNQPELQLDGSVKLQKTPLQKRFRRFVQAKLGTLSRSFGPSRGYRVRWFKEFQDPRVIDYETGNVVDGDKVKDFPAEKQANELIHWKIYTARSPYGLPRFIGNLITIFGARAAEEINFITLKNNNIPSMAVLVSNGQLTQGSIDRIQEFVEAQVQGSENYSRFLIVEAEGQYEGQDGGIKVDIKPLTDQQMRDQMFQEYDKNNAAKVRKSWRLPPIFVGSADDYSKATAEESRKLADEQVFKPERDVFDSHMNKFLLPEMGVVYHNFVSNGPNVTDDQDLIAVLVAAERTGGLTPRIAREIVGDVLNKDIGEVNPAKIDPDVPFSLQVAEAVKNAAATQTGTPEIGSQATALKSIGYRDLLAAALLGRDELEQELEKLLSKREATRGKPKAD